MTKAQIQAVIQDIEARFPGLRLSNRYAWNLKVAYKCYLVDQTVGQKRADKNRPISDDTIGWSEVGPVVGAPASEHAIRFNAVDLLDGTTGAIHFDENPGITNQLFVVPLVTDIVGGGVPVPPVPIPPVHKPYPGDAYFRDQVGKPLAADYAAAGQAMNDGSVVWASRTIWDHVNEGLTMDASVAKHRAEWRQALGLPPV